MQAKSIEVKNTEKTLSEQVGELSSAIERMKARAKRCGLIKSSKEWGRLSRAMSSFARREKGTLLESNHCALEHAINLHNKGKSLSFVVSSLNGWQVISCGEKGLN